MTDQASLQRAVDSLVDELDVKHLRPIRKQCFLTMAKCCDHADKQVFQQCLQRASAPEERAGAVIQRELGEFQSRLQRAALACQDEVKDKGFKDPEAATGAFNKCLVGVFDKHVKMLPTMKKRILDSI